MSDQSYPRMEYRGAVCPHCGEFADTLVTLDKQTGREGAYTVCYCRAGAAPDGREPEWLADFMDQRTAERKQQKVAALPALSRVQYIAVWLYMRPYFLQAKIAGWVENNSAAIIDWLWSAGMSWDAAAHGEFMLTRDPNTMSPEEVNPVVVEQVMRRAVLSVAGATAALVLLCGSGALVVPMALNNAHALVEAARACLVGVLR